MTDYLRQVPNLKARIVPVLQPPQLARLQLSSIAGSHYRPLPSLPVSHSHSVSIAAFLTLPINYSHSLLSRFSLSLSSLASLITIFSLSSLASHSRRHLSLLCSRFSHSLPSHSSHSEPPSYHGESASLLNVKSSLSHFFYLHFRD
ncbi:hypothetical protein RIF29_38476 [Crotalaria pallida]|uniref:Uncharacterized protein n=1 Tax=Crotalaria pallida TaxID=3830 RepID=A0AAN9E2C4_CROPI